MLSKIYQLDWHNAVTQKAHLTLSDAKYNRTELLPFVDDIVKLNKYIDKRSEEILLAADKLQYYLEFCWLCLTHLIHSTGSEPGKLSA